MKFAHSQKGMSMLGWLLALVVVAFVASTAFKVLPHYLDHKSMEKIITSVETDPALDIRTVGDFYSHIGKGMQINAIELDLKKAVDIKVANNMFLVHLKYEKREPLIKNIDLVINFDNEYRVRMP